MEKRTRGRLGAVALIGFGVALWLHNVVPQPMHGALMVAMFALALGALYGLGGARFSWARVPALVLSALSGFVFLTALPGQSMRTWWPLLIVAAGLWILRPNLRTWVR